MQINLMLNGVRVSDDVAPDTLLIDFVRRHGCLSVKRGCETSNCGLCTVFLDDKPVLSCSVLAARADGHKVTTLEGLQEEAAEFGAFIADQRAARRSPTAALPAPAARVGAVRAAARPAAVLIRRSAHIMTRPSRTRAWRIPPRWRQSKNAMRKHRRAVTLRR